MRSCETIRRTVFRPATVALLLLLAVGSAAQDRYRVTLRFDADDDPATVTRQLTAMYRIELESDAADPSTIVVRGSEAGMRMLRADRRVIAVEPADPRGFGAYAYDGAGNITQIGTDAFDYDRFGRIRNATIAGIEQTFTYDRHGNITTIATSGESERTIGVDANNKLSGATYDGSGNLVSYSGGAFIYDGLNVVKEFTPNNGNRHLYLYSASNERVATIELLPGGRQQSDWTIRDDAGKILRRYRKHSNGAWSWEEDYIYRGSQLLAAEVPGSEKVRHFHLDHLGTPRLITGNGGAILAERTYGAFGRGLIVESTPAPDERAQFTGHERDNFQLDYMHARYYEPMLGRFLAIDAGEPNLRRPQSWNRYSYAHNNPIKYVDPDGNIPVETVIDVASLGASVYSMAAAPSWANLGYLAWDAASVALPYVPGSWVAKVGKYGHRGLQAVGVVGKLDALETAINNSLVREGVALLGQGDDSVKQVLGLSRADSAADFLGVTKGGTFKIVEAKGSNVGDAVAQIAATAAALKAHVGGGVSFTAEIALKKGQQLTGDYRVVGNHLQRFNSGSNKWERVLVDGNQVTVRYY